MLRAPSNASARLSGSSFSSAPQPLAVFLGLGSFIVYSTWAAFQNAHYTYGPYLSPFYSPELFGDAARLGLTAGASTPNNVVGEVVERILALRQAVHHLNKHGVPGAFVECGVYKGGSAIAAIVATREGQFGIDRDVWLYDTFEGMTAPTAVDVTFDGVPAQVDMDLNLNTMVCPLDEVKGAIDAVTGYQHIHYVKGRVEETIPRFVPDEIALLRLDTDWYESTKHELEHLYPLLAPGGIILIDDYGHWEGARRAVDDYWHEHMLDTHLARIDYTGRIGVKL